MIEAGTAPIALMHPLAPEDRSRCDFYALLARLYADAPDAALLRSIADAPRMDTEGPLAQSWNRLADASSAMDADAATQEYNDLFIGVGKCPVNLHGSHWISGAMLDRPLAELRTSLAAIGLARRPNVLILEDHLSALFESMRLLIGGQHARAPASIEAQRAFFERHIAPWAFRCCTAIQTSGIANYYVRVAEFTTNYVALDRDALAMD